MIKLSGVKKDIILKDEALCTTNLLLYKNRLASQEKQECIPVGCVPSATVAVCRGVPAPGGCLPAPGAGRVPGPGGDVCSRGVVSQHALRQTPPVNRMTDRQV